MLWEKKVCMWEGLSHTKKELESHSSGLLRPQGPNFPMKLEV